MPDPLDPVEALRRYGDHDADCPAWDERHSLDLLGNLNTDRGPCECGFDIAHAVLAARAALAALPAPVPKLTEDPPVSDQVDGVRALARHLVDSYDDGDRGFDPSDEEDVVIVLLSAPVFVTPDKEYHE